MYGVLSFFSGGREIGSPAFAHVAQSVERVLGKDEVISSILIMGSRLRMTKIIKLNNKTTNAGDNNG